MKKYLSFILFGIILIPLLSSQDLIIIKGQVRDANTGEGLPFANLVYTGNTSIGTNTDLEGKYELISKWGSDSISVSYLGYIDQAARVDKSMKNQTINFELIPEGYVLEEVKVFAEKVKYSRKNNPAVELIKKVIANKDKNRMQSQEYYECDQYEKVKFSLNNFSDQLFTKKYMKDFQFLKNHVDTSSVNGKPFIPFYLRERASKLFFRKNPTSKKEYIKDEKETNIDILIIDDNISTIIDHLYQDVDIYDNNVNLLGKSIISPISSVVGNAFYHYHIMDTIMYKGIEVIKLSFMPSNRYDIGFNGDLLITNDSTYAVVKAELSMDSRAQINWVSDMKLIQEFQKTDGQWIIAMDEFTGDFSINQKSNGFFGTRTVYYSNYVFGKVQSDEIYSGILSVEGDLDNAIIKQPFQMENAKPQEIKSNEDEVYAMIDTLKRIPSFKRISKLTTVVTTGYLEYSNFEVGPLASFFSFNDVEGFRAKIGGVSTINLMPNIRVAGYGAYGFKDNKFKYSGELEYSFNDDFRTNPKTFLRASYSHDAHIVGQNLDLVNENNFFLSFRRGDASKYVFTDNLRLEYAYEYKSDLRYNVFINKKKEVPLGSLKFERYTANDRLQSVESVTNSEIGFHLRWAPNEKYIQLHEYRKEIYNEYPIFEIEYSKGIKGVLGGEYDYHKFTFTAFKRFYLSPIGTSDIVFEGGKIWGKGLPYYALLIPRGNQTFFEKHRNFNMMNFLEFTSDSFLSCNFRHSFNGLIMNRIPLLKKLGLRSVITFKGIWGNLSDANNPNLRPEIIQITENLQKVQDTYALTSRPYMEASFGISNIFQIGRIDIVQRINYLDNPSVPMLFGVKGMGIRAKFAVEF